MSGFFSVHSSHRKLHENVPGFRDIPSGPCSRESLLRAMREQPFAIMNRSLTTDPSTTAATIARTLATAEWFDFGRVDANSVAEASTDARPFFNEGLLRPPYPSCAFRMRLFIDDSDGGEETEIETVLIVDEEEANTTIIQLRSSGTRNEFASMSSAVVIRDNRPMLAGDDTASCQATLLEYLGLWTMLNARGVGKVIEEPSDKLNRARARSGKPPLKRVLRIDAQQYITALNETKRRESAASNGDGEGTHASPRTHLRRGHLRRYEAERFSRLPLDRRVKWIRPMIINGDGDIDRNREAYRVVIK